MRGGASKIVIPIPTELNMHKKILLSVSFIIFISCFSNAQITVSGEVLGKDDKLALPAVSITSMSDSTNTVVSSIDGHFTITVKNKSEVLRFAFFGYLSKQVEASALLENDKIYLIPDCIIDHWDFRKIGFGVSAGLENFYGASFHLISPIIIDSRNSNLSLGEEISFQGDLKNSYWVKSEFTAHNLILNCNIGVDGKWVYNRVMFQNSNNFISNSFTLSSYLLNNGKTEIYLGYASLSKENRQDSNTFKENGLALGMSNYIRSIGNLSVQTNFFKSYTELDITFERYFKSLNVFMNYHGIGQFNEFRIGIKRDFWYRL
tara:strand:+ start:2198 stop:3154 length:957 start_codon:yes stop_codon:yes gene_type:complete